MINDNDIKIQRLRAVKIRYMRMVDDLQSAPSDGAEETTYVHERTIEFWRDEIANCDRRIAGYEKREARATAAEQPLLANAQRRAIESAPKAAADAWERAQSTVPNAEFWEHV